ncbi:hypothetical protein [Streptomyces sp. NPDC047009]
MLVPHDMTAETELRDVYPESAFCYSRHAGTARPELGAPECVP